MCHHGGGSLRFRPTIRRRPARRGAECARRPAARRFRPAWPYTGSQVLDHILTSRAVHRPDYDIVHINAEFADQSSDHDPQVVRLKP